MRQLPLLGFPRFTMANKLFQTFFCFTYLAVSQPPHTQVKKKIQIVMPSIIQQ